MRKIIALSAVLFSIIMLYSLKISAQQEMIIINNAKYYPDRQRTPVSFQHMKHMDFTNGCITCHHRYDARGKNVLAPEELAEGEKSIRCTSCHADPGKSKYKLYQYYHIQCIGCHESSKSAHKGPRLCADCHPVKGDR